MVYGQCEVEDYLKNQNRRSKPSWWQSFVTKENFAQRGYQTAIPQRRIETLLWMHGPSDLVKG